MAPVSVSGLYIFRGRERDGKFGGNRAGRFSSGGTDGLRAALCSFPLEVEEQVARGGEGGEGGGDCSAPKLLAVSSCRETLDFGRSGESGEGKTEYKVTRRG